MKNKSIDVFLISKPEDKFYLSGFEASHYFIILIEDKNYLLTDFRYFEAANDKKDIFDIVRIDAHFSVFDFLSKYDKIKLGIEEKHLSALEYKKLLKQYSSENIVGGQEIIETQRMIKDKSELQLIKNAAEIADDAFKHLLAFIKPGLTEREVALELEFHMKKQGASGLSFDTIVASGKRSSLPHGTASDKILEKGDLITLDFGCIVECYSSDMTRTIALGQISDEQKRVYHIVKDAQERALKTLKAGIEASLADKAARDIIEAEGFGEYFGHGLGHGVGLEVHEGPRLSPASEVFLEENMVVTVEPGIYIPMQFGTRIEDLVVVTNDGINNYTSSTKELIII